ncbi:hypothetical protein [Bythopirellula polymerisocia]|uniref:Uncharacterized protein n=1 Tax=Bythopirellula polymerisocia TaxID=2528003 RepID=A0A5C6C9U7_9BACT|nr:hypothetical protein [Bythopirellula polymerisocia]TWU20912.1 hypothetical protein Pla144_48130 [Bythopirellula polymerisocia]
MSKRIKATKQGKQSTSADRDWQAELPFLDWSPEGKLTFCLDSQGKIGYQRKDGSCIASSDPLLAEYQAEHGAAAALKREFSGVAHAADEIHKSITDLSNDEPMPLSIMRKDPDLAAWLNGENPNYAPGIYERMILWPAFIERRRKLKERQHLQSQVSQTEVSQVPEPAPALPVVRLTKTAEQILAIIDEHGFVETLEDLLDKASAAEVILSESTAKHRLREMKANGTLVAFNATNNRGYQRPPS